MDGCHSPKSSRKICHLSPSLLFKEGGGLFSPPTLIPKETQPLPSISAHHELNILRTCVACGTEVATLRTSSILSRPINKMKCYRKRAWRTVFRGNPDMRCWMLAFFSRSFRNELVRSWLPTLHQSVYTSIQLNWSGHSEGRKRSPWPKTHSNSYQDRADVQDWPRLSHLCRKPNTNCTGSILRVAFNTFVSAEICFAVFRQV